MISYCSWMLICVWLIATVLKREYAKFLINMIVLVTSSTTIWIHDLLTFYVKSKLSRETTLLYYNFCFNIVLDIEMYNSGAGYFVLFNIHHNVYTTLYTCPVQLCILTQSTKKKLILIIINHDSCDIQHHCSTDQYRRQGPPLLFFCITTFSSPPFPQRWQGSQKSKVRHAISLSGGR